MAFLRWRARVLLPTLLALVAAVILMLGFGLRVYTGQVIQRQVAQFETLVQSRPDLILHELNHVGGLLNSQLTFDIELSDPGARLAPWPAQLPKPKAALRFDGQARIEHGPIVWPGQEFTWARAEFAVMSPGANAEWMSGVQASHLVSGVLTAPDPEHWLAQGRIAGTAAEHPGTRWETGTFRIDWRTQGAPREIVMTTPELSVAGATGGQAEALQLIWQSGAKDGDRLTLSARQLEVPALPGLKGPLQIEQPSWALSSQRQESGLQKHNWHLAAGSIQTPHLELDAAEFGLTLGNLEPGTLTQLTQVVASAADTGPTERTRQRLQAQWKQLARTGATLALDPVSISLGAPDNLNGQLAIELPAQDLDIPPEQAALPIRLLQGAQVDLNAGMTLGALRRITRLQAQTQARQLEAEQGLDYTREQTDRMAASAYRSALLALQFMPLVEVADGHIRLHLQLKDRVIYRNNERLMALPELLGMLGLG